MKPSTEGSGNILNARKGADCGRGIGPPQLFHHPYIEETMWTRDTSSSSSEDPESDAESDEISVGGKEIRQTGRIIK
jgi:hypothetical protein